MKKGQLMNALVTALVGVVVILVLLSMGSKGAQLWQQNAESSKLQHFESFSGILKGLATSGGVFTYEDGVATIPKDRVYIAFNDGANTNISWPTYSGTMQPPSTCSGTCICYFSQVDFVESNLDHVPCTNFPPKTYIYSRLDSNDNNYGQQVHMPVEVDGITQYEKVAFTTMGTVQPVYFDKVLKNGKTYIYVGFYDEEYQEKRIKELK